MYIIVKKGSHQYRVCPGQFIKMEKIDQEVGAQWRSDQILAFKSKEGQVLIGAPYLEKSEIKGRVVRHGKSKKVLVFKKKRRKGYRKTQGHRQEFTEVYIETFCTPQGEKIEVLKEKKQEIANHSQEN